MATTEAKKKAMVRYNREWRNRNREHCRTYGRIWARNHRKRKTAARIAMKQHAVEYLGGKCIECGFSKHNAALTFHHRDGSTKEFTLATMMMCSWELIKKELDKCDLMCSNCHNIWHYEKVRGEKCSKKLDSQVQDTA